MHTKKSPNLRDIHTRKRWGKESPYSRDRQIIPRCTNQKGVNWRDIQTRKRWRKESPCSREGQIIPRCTKLKRDAPKEGSQLERYTN